MSAHIVTFGCRLNSHDSAVIAGLASAAGLGSETVVVNTCAVTAEAERQARQAIRRLRRDQPGARIIVTGCAAEVGREALLAMPEVDHVLGNAAKTEPAAWAALAAPAPPRLTAPDIMCPPPLSPPSLTAPADAIPQAGRARAFLQVQTGCDHRCTFCIIPFGRGPARSLPVGGVVTAARRLVEAGYVELALTGVDITAYGQDLPGRPTLGQMVTRLLRLVPGIGRLRLSSLDPVEIDDAVWRLIAEEPRLAPHLHLSAQAGDDLVLKRMKRRHLRADLLTVAERARRLRPGLTLGADLIAGFPTETEAMFRNTEALVAEAGLAFAHVFPYSPRPGTPAARMPQVPLAERRARAERLRHAAAAERARLEAAMVGRTDLALVEEPVRARAANYLPLTLTGAAPVGQLVPVAIGPGLAARPLDRAA